MPYQSVENEFSTTSWCMLIVTKRERKAPSLDNRNKARRFTSVMHVHSVVQSISAIATTRETKSY